MTSTTLTARATRTSLLPMRIGLVLGAVLSALQIITGVGLWRAEGFSVGAAVLVAVPIVALVAIVFAWRGSFAARLVTIVVCLVPALTGLPVYFISDIPAEAVISVSIGIFWALLVAILLLLPGRRPAH